ncbi:MAG: phosphoglycerate kinase [archaeon]
MKLRTLSTLNVRNKRVLLRLDLNTEIIKGKAQFSERMKAHMQTLNELKKKKAKTVILAHQSRPGEKDFTSLKQHAKLIKAKFVPDILGKQAIKAITTLKPGEVLLLENIRSEKDEFNTSIKNNSLITILAPLFDIYINDAFSVSHRAQTSVTGFPKVLPCGIGRVMEAEVKSLEKINLKDTLYIFGGAKPKENIDIVKSSVQSSRDFSEAENPKRDTFATNKQSLHSKRDSATIALSGRVGGSKNISQNVLTCGIFGQLCTIAKGTNLGAQNEFLDNKIKEFVPALAPLVKNIFTPIDFAVNVNGKRKDISLKDFPSEYEIFDIGPQTQKLYVKKIKQAKSIFMKGVAGYCEDMQFCQGTNAIMKAIANSKAFSVVGGGHTTDAISKLKINKKKFGYISLSGGALDEYIAGKKLQGLEVLKKNKR